MGDILFAQTVELEQVCNLKFRTPINSKRLQLKHDLALYREAVKINHLLFHRQWMITCKPNKDFTSKVGELEFLYRQKGDRVSHHKEFLLPGEFKIQAASLQRLRVSRGRKLLTYEVYFATRDYEYQLHLLPENIKDQRIAVELVSSKQARFAMQEILESVEFQTPPNVTITESQFMWRLRFSLIGILLFAIVLVWLLFRRRKPTQRTKQETS